MAIGSAGLSALVGCVGSLVAMPSQPPAAVTLSVIGDAPDDRLETFLAERIQATWPLAPSQAGVETEEIVVRLEWGQQTVDVAIVRRSETLARRTLTYHGDGSTLAAAWLLTRGTIHRSLSEEPAQPPPQPEKPEVLEVPDPRAPSPAAVVNEEVTPPLVSTRKAGEWQLALLTQLGVERAELIGVGGSLEGSVALSPEAEIAVSGGYRYTPGGDGLTIHSLPLRAIAGWRLGFPNSVLLGASAVVELKLVEGERRTTVVGAHVGPYAGIGIPVAEDLTWLVRFHFDVRLVRQRYVVTGDEIAEQPLAASLLTGLSWN